MRLTEAARATDHPRACGANVVIGDGLIPVAGSSPRVRGKPAGHRRTECGSRIIPARAGQTSASHLCRWAGPDHPRACGANVNWLVAPSSMYGSSPRVRGKPSPTATTRARGRIIPARAGQTSPCCPHAIGSSDHPRACGANVVVSECHDCVSGSSPRVRGKRDVPVRIRVRARIIPARAGQTITGIMLVVGRADHPRACGANSANGANAVSHFGSSPRVRGKPADVERAPHAIRIIPARAGQT